MRYEVEYDNEKTVDQNTLLEGRKQMRSEENFDVEWFY
jgi:hypothetical protein